MHEIVVPAKYRHSIWASTTTEAVDEREREREKTKMRNTCIPRAWAGARIIQPSFM